MYLIFWLESLWRIDMTACLAWPCACRRASVLTPKLQTFDMDVFLLCTLYGHPIVWDI